MSYITCMFAYGSSSSHSHVPLRSPVFNRGLSFEKKKFLSLAWTLLLLTALFGCGPIIKAEYPVTWPPRVTNGAQPDCLDISGTYKASNGDSLLPFFVFGIPDTNSLDWSNLVKINEQVLADPDGATVTIRLLNVDHIEVVVAMHGTTIAKQLLIRSRTPWWGPQQYQSFSCEPDRIVMIGAYINNWNEYRLPYEEKKRLYGGKASDYGVGTSRGYFDFSKATDGSLVMRQRVFVCLGCGGLDERWRKWEPMLSPRQ